MQELFGYFDKKMNCLKICPKRIIAIFNFKVV